MGDALAYRLAAKRRTETNRSLLLGDLDALAGGLVAQGSAHRVVEGPVALLGVLLHLLADVLRPLLAQLRYLRLDGQPLAQRLLDVLDTLVRLELAQLVTELVVGDLGDVELGVLLEAIDEVPAGVAVQGAALGGGAGGGDAGGLLGGVEVLGLLVLQP